MDYPRLKAHFCREVVDPETVFLLAEGEQYLVHSAGAAALLPLLDGRHRVGDVVAHLAGRLSLTETLLALRRFQAGGHLAEGRPDLPDPVLAYWDARGVDPAAVVAAGSADLRLLAAGAVDPSGPAALLRESGLPVRLSTVEEVLAASAGGGRPGLDVVLVDDYLNPALAELNAAYLAQGRPWLPVKPTGVVLWVGPLLRPGHTGCWACLEQRLAGNRQVERYVAGKRGAAAPYHAFPAAVPAGQQVAAGLVAADVGQLLATGTAGRLDGRLLTVDLRTLAVAEHELVRQPQCRACGDPTLVTERSPKVVLQTRPATHTTDGGYRVQSPGETYARLSKHVSPYLGAVSSLRPWDEVDNGVSYSFTAGHNFAMVNDNMDLLRRNLRGQSGGKGRTEIQAKVSGLCEAIERYAAVWRGEEPVVRAAWADLDPAAAVHPDDLLHFSARQLADRDAWNADPGHRMHLVPAPLRPDLPIDWSTAWSLTHQQERLVPAGYAWYGHPDLARSLYCITDSNGSAAGNTLEEAVLQGLCELVERDSVALWWYNRTRRPGFDLDSLADPYVARLREFYAGMQRDLWVMDITSDVGIPAFVGASTRDHPVQDIMIGFGCHPDPRIAVLRALTEVNQFLPFVERRDARGETRYLTDDPETVGWLREVTVSSDPWVAPDPAQPARTLADYQAPAGDDLAEHVADCVGRVEARGLDVVVLDQTRPDLDLAVVKVIVPGLRHFWRRLGPGRLYTAPVRLGWLDRPRTEDEMNPRNVFF